VHEGLLDQSEAVILKHFQKIYQPFFTRLVLAGRSGVGTSRLSQLSSRDPKTRLTCPSRPAILFVSLAVISFAGLSFFFGFMKQQVGMPRFSALLL
jgi:hypothetical protein